MGRYDWQERQEARDSARRSPRPWVSPGKFALALLSLLLGGAAVFALLGSEPKPTTGASPSSTPAGIQHRANAADRKARVQALAYQGAAERSDKAVEPSERTRFELCGLVRETCVVDGDTFWIDGQKIRIADIDTPEVSQPQCATEKALGDRATDRLMELLNQGPFELTSIGDRDEDQHGRKLRVVVRDGRSLGDQLVSEGLARTWTGRREPWC